LNKIKNTIVQTTFAPKYRITGIIVGILPLQMRFSCRVI